MLGCQHATTNMEELSGWLSSCPVWGPLSFLRPPPALAARLLGLLQDPRWHIDPESPEGVGTLHAFLGLNPRAAQGRGGTAGRSYNLVLAQWQRTTQTGCNFLGRYFQQQLQDRPQEPWRAELRTSQLFIRFLREVWLDCLYPSPPWRERLFVSSYFFASPEEAAAFDRHVSVLPPSR